MDTLSTGFTCVSTSGSDLGPQADEMSPRQTPAVRKSRNSVLGLEAEPFGDIEVVVRDLATAKTYSVFLEADSPVGLLKMELVDVLGVSVSQQVWTYRGRELQDSEVMGDCIQHSRAEILVDRRQEQ